MAKIVIQHNDDPSIGIVLEELGPDEHGRVLGWRGTCTECGWSMHRWNREKAIDGGQAHVDQHESSL